MALGILDGTPLTVQKRATGGNFGSFGSSGPLAAPSGTAPSGSAVRDDVSIYTLPPDLKPDEMIQLCKDHKRLLEQFKSHDPEMGQLLEAQDLSKLRVLMMKRAMVREKVKYVEKQDEIKFLANPDDPALQKKMAEKIRLDNIDENYRTAQEYLPEAFGTYIGVYRGALSSMGV